MICPCCERQARPRSTPLSETGMRLTLELMAERGWTVEALLQFRRPELDFLAPGMVAWLEDAVRGAGRRRKTGSHDD